MVCVAIGSSTIIEQAVAIDDRGFRALYGTQKAIGEAITIDSRCSSTIGAIATKFFVDSRATVSVQLDLKLVSMSAFLNSPKNLLGLCLILW